MTESTESVASFGTVKSTVSTPYREPGSTQSQPTQPVPQREADEPAGLTGWLATSEARELVGQWVLLTRSYEMIDHALTPSELFDRNPDIRNPFIVFVRPRNIRFIG